LPNSQHPQNRPGNAVLSATVWKELVSGKRRGLVAALTRALLWWGQWPYRLIVAWRNGRYDRGRLETHAAAVPVISVGNLTVGGTGKTPMVAWLARWFRDQGIRVSIISRGYGAERGAVNDEALELEDQLPDVPHLQNPDRVAAAGVAVEELTSQLILLDDAFQHRRIARDLDIVLLDALEPFGFDHLIPRGTLREPPASLRRAHVIGLSRADMIDDPRRDEIWQRVRRIAPDVIRLELAHRPQRLIAADGREQPLATLDSLPVAAFCGIGNPAGFQNTLLDCGCKIEAFRALPDHCPYERTDVESLGAWAEAVPEAQALICTHKDLVKLRTTDLGGRPLWALAIAMEILQGGELIEDHLQRLAKRAKAGPPVAEVAKAFSDSQF
jgi:tetraacyldisaccharide 4'-kinase